MAKRLGIDFWNLLSWVMTSDDCGCFDSVADDLRERTGLPDIEGVNNLDSWCEV
jgi:hypothetical protein